MIPDHANPHEKPTKVLPAPQLTCNWCGQNVKGDGENLTPDFWARVGWWCSCGNYIRGKK